MSERMHVIGECDDARRRRLAREQRQAAQWVPGESFQQYDRRMRLASGEIAAGSTASLSERDRLRLGALRQDIIDGAAASIPSDLRRYCYDLLGESPEIRATAKTATSRAMLATVEAMSHGEGIDAAQVQEFARDHAERLAKQPLSRELRQALGPHTLKISARMLHEECRRLGYSTSQCLSVALEASSKGRLVDEMAPEPIAMSDDLQTILTGQALPMHCEAFYKRCQDFGYDTHHATVLAMEAGPRVYYGDARQEYTPTRVLHASGKQKVVDKIQASSGGRCAYDGTGIAFKDDTHLAGRPIRRKAASTYEC